nr:MAG TPA: hypothetical protein [Caudoviricetes sp.]
MSFSFFIFATIKKTIISSYYRKKVMKLSKS